MYAAEDRAKALALSAEQRLALRKRVSARLLENLHKYLLELKQDVLPKSPAGAAVRYALNQWEALTRFVKDGDLEIDNGASERATLRYARFLSPSLDTQRVGRIDGCSATCRKIARE